MRLTSLKIGPTASTELTIGGLLSVRYWARCLCFAVAAFR